MPTLTTHPDRASRYRRQAIRSSSGQWRDIGKRKSLILGARRDTRPRPSASLFVFPADAAANMGSMEPIGPHEGETCISRAVFDGGVHETEVTA